MRVSFVPSDGSRALSVLFHGEPETVDEERAKEILQEEFDLGLGGESSKYWTCDFRLCEYGRL